MIWQLEDTVYMYRHAAYHESIWYILFNFVCSNFPLRIIVHVNVISPVRCILSVSFTLATNLGYS